MLQSSPVIVCGQPLICAPKCIHVQDKHLQRRFPLEMHASIQKWIRNLTTASTIDTPNNGSSFATLFSSFPLRHSVQSHPQGTTLFEIWKPNWHDKAAFFSWSKSFCLCLYQNVPNSMGHICTKYWSVVFLVIRSNQVKQIPT